MANNQLYNEKMLLLGVANGDERAFTELFNHYRPNLYTTALRMTGSAPRAEEILQDAFLKVWLKRERLPEIDNFAGWLYTIAENLTLNAIRQLQREKKRLEQFSQDPGPEPSAGIESFLAEKEYSVLLNKAIHRLPGKQQQTYILIKQHGFQRSEAARILQVSSETVKWNLEQAMRSIRAFCLANLETWAAIIFLTFLT